MLNHPACRKARIRRSHLERTAKVQPEHRSGIVHRILGHGRVANLLLRVHRENRPDIGLATGRGLDRFSLEGLRRVARGKQPG